MWLSDRRAFLVLAAAALAGCGFTPVYGPSGDATALWGRSAYAAPGQVEAFDLVRRLEERLGRAGAPRYMLDYHISIHEDDLGITPNQQITRYHVVGRVEYTVSDLSGTVLTRGAVDDFSSYAATGTTVGTLTSERAAFGRVMVILADKIVAQLLATSPDWMQ